MQEKKALISCSDVITDIRIPTEIIVEFDGSKEPKEVESKLFPSYLVRNPTLAPQLEKTHETPPSSRDEGLLFLHGLESNPESSLQTEEEG